MLLLRWMADHCGDGSAAEVLTQTQLQVLGPAMKRRRRPLSSNPTVHEALWAIAALGGHLKRNGRPGWLVLGRGFEELLLLEQGWLDAMTSLQSGAGIDG